MTSLQYSLDDSTANKVTAILSQENINSLIIQTNDDATQYLADNNSTEVDVIIIDSSSISYDSFQKMIVDSTNREIPSLAIISPESLLMLKDSEISDFITTPIKFSELITRCQRLTKNESFKSDEKTIKFGDLFINPSNYVKIPIFVSEVETYFCTFRKAFTSSFIGEILIIIGCFKMNSWTALFVSTGMVLGAGYSLWLCNRLLFGNIKCKFGSKDLKNPTNIIVNVSSFGIIKCFKSMKKIIKNDKLRLIRNIVVKEIPKI